MRVKVACNSELEFGLEKTIGTGRRLVLYGKAFGVNGLDVEGVGNVNEVGLAFLGEPERHVD